MHLYTRLVRLEASSDRAEEVLVVEDESSSLVVSNTGRAVAFRGIALEIGFSVCNISRRSREFLG